VKGKIKEVLNEYCKAIEALDPVGIQKQWPSADIKSFRVQLSKAKFNSAECKFADPVFELVDPSGGKVKLHVDLKETFFHTFQDGGKAEKADLTLDMAFSQANTRSPWHIDTILFKPKKK